MQKQDLGKLQLRKLKAFKSKSPEEAAEKKKKRKSSEENGEKKQTRNKKQKTSIAVE